MRILILALVLAFTSAPALAQKTEDAKKEQLKKRIRTMRAVILAEELELDEKTATKLMPILNKYDDDFAKLAREAVELRKQANQAAKKSDDKSLDTLIDKMVANQRARWDLDEKRFAEVRKVLTAKQAARILVVLPQIDRKILQGARRAVQGRPGKKARKARQADDENVLDPFADD